VVEEVVVTGSVSRGVADGVSDVEMLVVTPEPLELEDANRPRLQVTRVRHLAT